MAMTSQMSFGVLIHVLLETNEWKLIKSSDYLLWWKSIISGTDEEMNMICQGRIKEEVMHHEHTLVQVGKIWVRHDEWAETDYTSSCYYATTFLSTPGNTQKTRTLQKLYSSIYTREYPLRGQLLIYSERIKWHQCMRYTPLIAYHYHTNWNRI